MPRSSQTLFVVLDAAPARPAAAALAEQWKALLRTYGMTAEFGIEIRAYTEDGGGGKRIRSWQVRVSRHDDRPMAASDADAARILAWAINGKRSL
jgi:hypothetical protein